MGMRADLAFQVAGFVNSPCTDVIYFCSFGMRYLVMRALKFMLREGTSHTMFSKVSNK